MHRLIAMSCAESAPLAIAARGVSKAPAKLAYARPMATLTKPRHKTQTKTTPPRTAAVSTSKPVERSVLAPSAPAPTRAGIVARFRKLEGELVAMMSRPGLQSAERSQLVDALAACRSSLVECGEQLPPIKLPVEDIRLAKVAALVRRGQAPKREPATASSGSLQFVRSSAGEWDPRRGWVS
jgi:hypothetical protein